MLARLPSAVPSPKPAPILPATSTGEATPMLLPSVTRPDAAPIAISGAGRIRRAAGPIQMSLESATRLEPPIAAIAIDSRAVDRPGSQVRHESASLGSGRYAVSPVERLNGDLLVEAEHRRVTGRVQLSPMVSAAWVSKSLSVEAMQCASRWGSGWRQTHWTMCLLKRCFGTGGPSLRPYGSVGAIRHC